MSGAILIRHISPGVSVQDMGRPGFLAHGLSRGGAADTLALHEGAALLGHDPALACLEMANVGGTFETLADCRIALTGAPMRARLDGVDLAWHTSHSIRAGSILDVGAVRAGCYGYLHFGGGIAGLAEPMGSPSVHFAAGVNTGVIAAGDTFSLGTDPGHLIGQTLDVEPRFDGGRIRCVPSLQTAFFDQAQLDRFQDTTFERAARANRMGVGILGDGPGFHSSAGLSILSEVIVPGDIQITGDGMPFVLLCECQTTGGYPRIGTVIPSDLPRVAQAPAGAPLQFEFIDLAQAVAIEQRVAGRLDELRRSIRPLVRDPRDMPDLLAQQLISGIVAGDEFDPGR